MLTTNKYPIIQKPMVEFIDKLFPTTVTCPTCGNNKPLNEAEFINFSGMCLQCDHNLTDAYDNRPIDPDYEMDLPEVEVL